MVLPKFAWRSLASTFRPGVRESLLCIARKNAKSAICAVLILAHLADDGPMRRRGFVPASVRSAGRKRTSYGSSASKLRRRLGCPACRSRGHPSPVGSSQCGGTSIFSQVIAIAARRRDSIWPSSMSLGCFENEIVSWSRVCGAVSARVTVVFSLCQSVAPARLFLKSWPRRRPGTRISHYAAPSGAALDDPAAWRAANPGLGTIKSESYMRDEARRVSVTTLDQSAFRALDLNQPVSESARLVCDPADLVACESDVLPARDGPAFVGLDLGGSSSLTAAAAYWPVTGRFECWAAFGDTPDLLARGASDGVGELYVHAKAAGELLTFPGRVTPVREFLGAVHDALAGAEVRVIGSDRYRRSEAMQAFDEASVRWPRAWRGTGASATADGSHDIRSFQTAILERRIVMRPTLMFAAGLAVATLRIDASGNPALAKFSHNSRIDLIAASVIAIGLSDAARRVSSSPRLSIAG